MGKRKATIFDFWYYRAYISVNMNEGAPIQDPSIPVPTPEAPRDSFGIQNFYSPDTLFILLNKDHKPHTNDLQNNWGEIAVSAYEPISSINARIVSHLKHESDESVKDRFLKTFSFCGWITTNGNILSLLVSEASKKIENPDFEPADDIIPFLSKDVATKRLAALALQEELIKSGINPNEINELSADNRVASQDLAEELIKLGINPEGLVFKGEGFFLSFRFDKNQIYLQSADSLSAFDDFAKKQRVFFINFEKVIRAVYKVQGKTLPPVKLEFKPQVALPQEFLAKCSYCHGTYSTAQDFACPGCGAKDPIFLILNKK